jgi:hypothetical protein
LGFQRGIQRVTEEVGDEKKPGTIRSGCTCQGVGAQPDVSRAHLPPTKTRMQLMVVKMQ